MYPLAVRIGFCMLLVGIAMILLPVKTSAQFTLRDQNGHILPTPSWPPPTGTYRDSIITVWFSSSAINDAFLCEYWWNDYKANDRGRSLLSYPDGNMPISLSLIRDTSLYQSLVDLHAVDMHQYTAFSPCTDTLSLTRNGDTIHTPKFWHSFVVRFDRPCAVQAVTALTIFHGGKGIEFAELIPELEDDGVVPNDNVWNLQSDMQTLRHGIDMPNAWSTQRGDRRIKVALFDAGFDYNQTDFGSGIVAGGTATARFANGIEYTNGGPVIPMSPTIQTSHGTQTASLIGAMCNNNFAMAGVAGGFNVNEGVSLYGGHVRTHIAGAQRSLDFQDVVTGWIDAAAQTIVPPGGSHPAGFTGFGVHVICNTNATLLFSEQFRRALDYAYRLNVVCLGSKGQDGNAQPDYPADFDYSKILAVGATDVNIVTTGGHTDTVPVRYQLVSDYDYGLDLMAPGSDGNGHHNRSLNAGGGLSGFTGTSAATPLVAGVAALLQSERLRVGGNPNIDGGLLLPEDVEGLLSISAMDMNFKRADNTFDTTGYDAETGYGLIKANTALDYMQSPYELRHFTATGGTVVDSEEVDPFVTIGPLTGDSNLLPPSSPIDTSKQYKATRFLVEKKVRIFNWQIARSWGIGGAGTSGWSGAMPADGNHDPNDNYTTGWCRVVGDAPAGLANFNYSELRDISYRIDTLTLQTYCYKVYNRPNGWFKGWYPCQPENVIYRYTIWGKRTTSGVEESPFITHEGSSITVRCSVGPMAGTMEAMIHYHMQRPGPVVVTIYDAMGNQIAEKHRDVWNYADEQEVWIGMEGVPSGVYIAIVRSKDGGAAGMARFSIVK